MSAPPKGKAQNRLVNHADVSVGNVSSVRKLLESALGEDQAEDLISNLSVPTEEAGIETLRVMDPKTIANFLKNEHPQTIALILAHLDAGKSAEIVSMLNEDIRGDVAYRLATLDRRRWRLSKRPPRSPHR